MNELGNRVWDGTPFDKNIVVVPKSEAKRFVCDKPWAAISISTEAGDFAELNAHNRVGLLRLRFWDSMNPTQRQIEAEDPNLFSPEQAEWILLFTQDVWPKIDTLLVHCEAGRSRSPAVAAAICHVMYGAGAEKEWFIKYNLNRFVYSRILEKHYGMSAAEMAALAFEMPKAKEEEVLDEPWDCLS